MCSYLPSLMRSVATDVRSPRISSTVASGFSVIVSNVRGFQFLICMAPKMIKRCKTSLVFHVYLYQNISKRQLRQLQSIGKEDVRFFLELHDDSDFQVFESCSFFLEFESRGSVWKRWCVHLIRIYFKRCRLYSS